MIKILHFCTNQIIGIIIIEIHFKKRQALCRSIPFTTGKIKKTRFQINIEGIVSQITFNLTPSVT